MKRRIAVLWAEHRLLFATFVLALVVTVLFAIRTVVFTIYWSDPSHANQAIEGWMTPRYIAYSHKLPVETVMEILGEVPRFGHPPTLERIARSRGITTRQLIAELTLAIHNQTSPSE